MVRLSAKSHTEAMERFTTMFPQGKIKSILGPSISVLKDIYQSMAGSGHMGQKDAICVMAFSDLQTFLMKSRGVKVPKHWTKLHYFEFHNIGKFDFLSVLRRQYRKQQNQDLRIWGDLLNRYLRLLGNKRKN